MEKIGIICEYNPFHNGHLYHIKKIKEQFPNAIIILALSGYFTERGDISLISKYNKTKIALSYGVDLVLEIPSLFSTNSADYFANGALKALNDAKCDYIIFGSETNDIEFLESIATKQINNPEFDQIVKEELSKGANYPTALSKACNTKLDSNDLLAISYIKEIKKNKYNIIPLTIKRTNSFSDTKSNDEIISAQNIREKLKNNTDISKYIPDYPLNYINTIDETKLYDILKYKIITTNDLSTYLGVDEGIDNKLKKEIYNSNSIDELILNIKSKRYTYVRLQRMLIHILLGIDKKNAAIKHSYTRILGFNSKGREYLKSLDNKNLITKNLGYILEIEKRASYIYYEITKDESSKIELLNTPINID